MGTPRINSAANTPSTSVQPSPLSVRHEPSAKHVARFRAGPDYHRGVAVSLVGSATGFETLSRRDVTPSKQTNEAASIELEWVHAVVP